MCTVNGALPPEASFASYTQQTAPKLRIFDFTEVNKILKELRDLKMTIIYKKSKMRATEHGIFY